jgi:hypothetical protein
MRKVALAGRVKDHMTEAKQQWAQSGAGIAGCAAAALGFDLAVFHRCG